MEVINIGRRSQNDVCFNDPYIGRHHCQIMLDDSGSFSIIDLNSTNGTYVNGHRISGEIDLNPDDIVRIGNTIIKWRNFFGKDSNDNILCVIAKNFEKIISKQNYEKK